MKRIKWTKELIQIEALKYDTKKDFRNTPAYRAAKRMGYFKMT